MADVGGFTASFKRLYRVHDTVADIRARAQTLYDSATSAGHGPLDGMPHAHNPHRLENLMCQLADLQAYADELLKQRARFDLFMCQLDYDGRRLLDLRVAQGLSWKEIADALHMAVRSCQTHYAKICDMAAAAGLFDDGDVT